MSEQFGPREGFPYRTNVQIWLSGHISKGGAGFVGNDRRIRQLELPSILFALLVVLIRKSKADEAADLEPWMPRGFLTKDQIHREMIQLGVECDCDYLPKYIYRAREIFDAVLGAGWGSRVLEYRKPFGYRLSTPAANLFLVNLDRDGEQPAN